MESGLSRKLLPHLICSAIWAGIVIIIHAKVRSVAIPSTLHTLIGLSLGLLLVFRTNSSYDRFWEGRKLLGSISGATRNLIRSTEIYFSDYPGIRNEIAEYALAFNYSLMQFLRGNVRKSPLLLISQIGRVIEQAKREKAISELGQFTLERYLQILVESLGGCERILKTPLPKVYVVHLHRALMVYCYTLPFALVETFQWKGMTILGTVFLVFVLFGIEEIGEEMENPFGDDPNDIPLDDIYQSIEHSMSDLRNPEALDEPLQM